MKITRCHFPYSCYRLVIFLQFVGRSSNDMCTVGMGRSSSDMCTVRMGRSSNDMSTTGVGRSSNDMLLQGWEGPQRTCLL